MGTIEDKKTVGIFEYIKKQVSERAAKNRENLDKYRLKILENEQREADAWRELIKEAEETKSLLNDRRYPGLIRFLDRCQAELEELIKAVALDTKIPDEMKFQMRDVAAGIRTLEAIRNYPEDVLNRYANLQKRLSGKG